MRALCTARDDGRGVELGYPPVVLAGRVGGDVGDAFGVGRPVELVDVEGGGGGLDDFAAGDGEDGDALDLDAILADDTGEGLHGGAGSGGARGLFGGEGAGALAGGR